MKHGAHGSRRYRQLPGNRAACSDTCAVFAGDEHNACAPDAAGLSRRLDELSETPQVPMGPRLPGRQVWVHRRNGPAFTAQHLRSTAQHLQTRAEHREVAQSAGAPHTRGRHCAPRRGNRLAGQCRWSRQPCTGSLNLRTSRSVNGLVVQPDQGDRFLALADVDPRAGRDLVDPPPVAGQHRARAVRVDVHGDRRLRRDDQRPGEQGMRVGRRHQQGIDPGPQHRAAGREGVGRRAGRRRAQHAVTAVGGDAVPVDLDDDVENSFPGAFFDADLVQRPTRGDQRRRRARRSPRPSSGRTPGTAGR